MEAKIDYQVKEKEHVYFFIMLVVSVVMYAVIANVVINEFSGFDQSKMSLYIFAFYVVLFLVFLFFRLGVLIGYIKGNAIKLSKDQFPDIYEMAVRQSALLGLNNVPSVYIMQSGGALNAFATRFMGANYIVLYSEVVETAYEQDKSLLEFIIGHELGHVKRNHLLKRLLLFPSLIVPFLGAAYSRACEYTCDRIGFSLAPGGVKAGLLVLASGRSIYKKVNVDEYINQGRAEGGFWKWFAEKTSSHPNLSKRIAVFEQEPVLNDKAPVEPKKAYVPSDYSKFMPQ